VTTSAKPVSRLVATSAGLFFLTASILALQLIEMRLLSFMLWHHLAYAVISVVLLGLGAGGAICAARSEWAIARAATIVPAAAALTGVTALAAFGVLTRIELDTFGLTEGQLAVLLLYYAILVVPYFFGGVALSLIFTTQIESIGLLYGVDLIGSAAGCYLFYLTLEPLGAPRAFVLACAAACVAGALLVRGFESTSPAGKWTAVGGLVVMLGAMPFADAIIDARPAPSKSLAQKLATSKGARLVSTRWTPISRIDVLEADESTNDFLPLKVPGSIMKMMTADGDANTWMFQHADVRRGVVRPGPAEYTSYTVAFLLKEQPDVMIIGPGGGNEIFVAHSMGARRIVGVELNPAMLDVTLRTYADFSGHLYGADNARAVVSEGRAFARSLGPDERFDIIQMSGVDTWAGLSSGAYVLSENFLYTTQAFQDFYTHLKEDGILSIGRFRLDPPRESLRLVSVALQALRELGVARPQEHVAALSFGTAFMGRLLVKRSAFTPSEVRLLKREIERAGGGGELYYAPGEVGDNPYSHLAVSFANGKEQAFFEEYPYDVTPVTDDRPFFFEYYKWSRLLRDLAHPGTGGQVGANRPVGLIILGGLLTQVGLLVLAFVFAPLWLFRRDGMNVPRWGSAVLYFTCLGLGFMFVEIGLMQRFVLFLAHPAYAIPVVLATLLVGSGAGSLLATRLPFTSEVKLRFCLVTIAVLLVVLLAVLRPLFDACLGLPFAARVVLAVSILIPLGIVLGMPFPLGLGRVGASHPHVVPWAWGINGGMSVLGSILAIVIAMGTGFSWVLLGAAGLYLSALWAAQRLAL
jgi:hypothetical protein